MKKTEKEITVTRYVAFDGTEFESEKQCIFYEGSVFGVLIQQLDKCTLSHHANGHDRHTYCLVPHTRHDIFVIEQILRIAGIETPCGELCDHLVQLDVQLECNTVAKADVTNLEKLILNISGGQFAVVSTIKSS